ncbi:MAG: HEAT repeat domain-containing protein [Anaerolineaceae bacterium]
MANLYLYKQAFRLMKINFLLIFIAVFLCSCTSGSKSITNPSTTPSLATLTARTQIAIEAAPFIANLGSEDWNTQYDAVNKIAGMGSDVIDLLIVELQNPDANVRNGAVQALGKIDDPQVVEILILALQDVDWHVRYTAAQDLGMYKDKRVVEPLIQALQEDMDNGVRFSAALSLGQIKDKRAVEALIEALKDQNDTVRLYSAMSLSEIGGSKARRALLQIKDIQIIALIHNYYIKNGGGTYVPLLIQALDQFGNQAMLIDYLNCGNTQLESAAFFYAESHGYTIEYFPLN